MPHGKGKYTWSKDDFYDGYWRFGVFHSNDGQYDGLKKASDGSEYKGEWKDGLPHGKGRCVYVDGSIYDGRWENGQPHGPGKKENLDSSYYDGNWVNGEAQGEGFKKLANGTTFKGLWDNSQFKQGKCIYPNLSTYEGAWNDGRPEGIGKRTW